MPKKKKSGTRSVAPVLHIFCEGEKTEPNYLEKYIQTNFAGDRTRNVIKIEPTKKNTPVQLVDEAVQRKKSDDCPKNDVFWVVYDREAVSKYPDTLHETAFQKAKKHGINIALSNVCFEIWLLLHFKDNTASYSCFKNLMTSSDLKKEMGKVGLANYDKGNSSIFDYVQHGIGPAKARSVNMNQLTLASAIAGKSKPYQLNPYTDMHLLLEAINVF